MFPRGSDVCGEQVLLIEAQTAIFWPMSDSQSTTFHCPNCRAKYLVVRAEAPPGPTINRELVCLSCGGPLHGREGKFNLKYFLLERWRGRE